MSSVDVKRIPANGVWRVGRAPDPLASSRPLSRADLDNPKTGNRFDSPTGSYRPLYFATKLDGCYGETLARYRPDLHLRDLISEEWQERGFMNVGEVPADWRQRRVAVRVNFPDDPRFAYGSEFLNVESATTRAELREELADILIYYGYDDLDVATIRSEDRRITRFIGQWAYEQVDEDGKPMFAGVRYLSRLNSDWECWTFFNDTEIRELSRQSILAEDPSLRRVARLYRIRVF